MNRRGFLRGAAVATGAGSFGLAGCLEQLGFEEESGWNTPALVDDRPENAVYVPAAEEEMASYGTATEGRYAVRLTYTFPHRFWLVGDGSSRVTSEGTERVEVETDDSMHLMLTTWDRETGVVLPVDASIDLRRDGESVTRFNPWPMLSQRMGFHYGDNVSLPEEGEYTSRIRVGPVSADRTGHLEGALEESAELEVPFEYAHSKVTSLGFDRVDRDRWGEPGAVDPMDHGHDHGEGGDHDQGESGDGSHEDHGDHGSGGDGETTPPAMTGPAVDELPGESLGTERSADAAISALRTDLERFAGGDSDSTGAYLAVLPRTPYNDVPIPFTSFSATVERDGSTLVEDARLEETLDHEFGHHYGVGLESLESGDEVTVSIDTPPVVSRHDGYETAFFEFEDVTYTV
ncbi:hypothetical protein ACFQGT_11710 [Natrialbaceae archaeon GCM10025810]|uniref:DUF7350 domain-containing protein n=1 Tax=Halovalidus salilacus TaxID=3075124 RepID=UPI00360BA10E